MFQDTASSVGGLGLGRFSPHTGLLWALEGVCWSADHLIAGARALAGLAAIDPGSDSQNRNRPIESLATILCGWVRHTSASLAQRVDAVDVVREVAPDVGWSLVVKLLPDQHGFVMPPAAPRIQDWRPNTSTVTMAEWIEFIHKLVQRAVTMASSVPDRLGTLAEELSTLPPSDREVVIRVLAEQTSNGEFDAEARFLLWEKLDRLVANHQRFASEAWALPADLLGQIRDIAARLEPKSDPQRFAYLFGWHPDLPDVEIDDYEQYESRAQDLRAEAIRTVLASDAPLEQLEQLARRVPVPGQLGWSLADNSAVSLRDLMSWFEPGDIALNEVAANLARRRLMAGGESWLVDALETDGLTPAARRVLIANAPARRGVWAALASCGNTKDLDSYWETAVVAGVPSEDVEEAASQLIRHGRAWSAMDMLTMALHTQRRPENTDRVGPAPEVLLGVLDAAIEQAPRPNEVSTMSGYNVGVLLDYLESVGTPGNVLAKYEFAYYRLLEHHRGTKALDEALATDPHLFVDLAKLVYRGKSETREETSDAEREHATQAWWVLRGWRGYPGRQADGTVDGDALWEWVTAARLEFSESDRSDIGDELIGQAFAYSPVGGDGIWPTEPIRDLIERVGSRELENGIAIGKLNSRGVTSRGVYDGGKQEWQLEATHRGWSNDIRTRWPRTSRILRDLAGFYERDARREDIRAAQDADRD
jgi:hypothetical protein